MRTGLSDRLFLAFLNARTNDARDLLFEALLHGRQNWPCEPGELFLAFDRTFRTFNPSKCNTRGTGGDILACTFLRLVKARAVEMARARTAEERMPLHVSRRRPERFTRISLDDLAELSKEDAVYAGLYQET